MSVSKLSGTAWTTLGSIHVASTKAAVRKYLKRSTPCSNGTSDQESATFTCLTFLAATGRFRSMSKPEVPSSPPEGAGLVNMMVRSMAPLQDVAGSLEDGHCRS
ncbi:hypothetical protein BDQ94DRAFT_135202 [Aspergillus welwitschiae]|uniref:Uncharacterized protein n=1 Tax=Aspergillus welwitschiae TaxID=1341132 RepID=A0A3F3QFD1_9EURO|nr:hypothetical protein BDQ94DRAFT_135202 [Aspergillus welwitschiae]RDH37881.1 hypothetical protein BDQ94DRAFT_135202 [Aspergillus welwitschiae]